MLIRYRGPADSRFDRDYWVDRHFALAQSIWRQHGLLSGTAFFPASAGGDELAVAVLTFTDEVSLKDAMNEPENARLVDDLRNFTDLQPEQYRLDVLG